MNPHRALRRVEFHETDMAGIVHFSNYFLWMEAAEHAFWREEQVACAPAPGATGPLWPRVAASFEFLQPLRFGEEIEVLLSPVSVGESSVTFRCEIRRDGVPAASGETTCVCCEREGAGALRKVPIPGALKERLRRRAGGSVS